MTGQYFEAVHSFFPLLKTDYSTGTSDSTKCKSIIS